MAEQKKTPKAKTVKKTTNRTTKKVTKTDEAQKTNVHVLKNKAAADKSVKAKPKKTAGKNNATKKTVNKVQKNIAAPQSQTKEKTMNTINFNPQQFNKMGEDAMSFGKDNMDAMTKTGQLYAANMQTWMTTWMSMAQDQSSKNANAMKDLMTCKTLNELSEKQTKLAQQNFEDMMSSMSKMSEMVVQMGSQCMEPLNKQMNKMMKKAG